jgi:CRP/FNR family transcriptional regulator, cyclic AMP receptor protein
MASPLKLQQVPMFRLLPMEELQLLEESATRRIVESGEAVFRQGDAADAMFIVESGAIDVAVDSESGELVVASFAGGSMFGELAIFDGQPRNATARATQKTRLIAIPARAVLALIERSPLAARRFLAVVAERLRGADDLVSRLQIRNVNEAMDERMTLGERVADQVARFGGSWAFLLSFGGFIVVWMLVNTHWLLTRPPDPFPHIFLNLMLSCLAAVQAPIIMMSQNRQSTKDRIQADMDYRVNIKSEVAVQQLHRKVDELRALVLQVTVERREDG